MPKFLDSDAEMAAYLANTEGAIGSVDSTTGAERAVGGTVRLSITHPHNCRVATAFLGESAIAAAKSWVYPPNHSRTKMEPIRSRDRNTS